MLEAPGKTIVISIFTGNHFGSGEMLENAIGLVAKDVADYFAYAVPLRRESQSKRSPLSESIRYAGHDGSYLDSVPFSGIIRIRDMMYSVADPFRLDQGDVSFDAPDTVKAAMTRAIAENKTHYLQTTGVPRLRELIAAKLRDKNRIPVDDADDVLVTNGGIHGLYIICRALLEPGDEVLVPDPEWPPAAGNILAARGVPVGVPAARVARLALRPRRARVEDHAEDARRSISTRRATRPAAC